MQFWKMNGAGNDFIILNNLQEGLSADCFPALARRLCERRLSIGADGLMVVERPQSGGDYRMLFYNSDGSAGEMCGNGARCICRYGYEIGLAGELQRVETTAGLVTGRRITRRQYKIELNRPTTLRLDYPVEVDGMTYPCSYVELGDPGLPHAVVPFPGLRGRPEAELFALGRKLRAHPAFPKGANVNFFDVEGPGRIWERTFERGGHRRGGRRADPPGRGQRPGGGRPDDGGRAGGGCGAPRLHGGTPLSDRAHQYGCKRGAHRRGTAPLSDRAAAGAVH